MVFLTTLVGNSHVGLESGKVLGPTSLAAGKVTLSKEVTEGVVVGVEGKLFATFKVMTKDFDSVNNGEEFLFMDGVVFFSRR